MRRLRMIKTFKGAVSRPQSLVNLVMLNKATGIKLIINFLEAKIEQLQKVGNMYMFVPFFQVVLKKKGLLAV